MTRIIVNNSAMHYVCKERLLPDKEISTVYSVIHGRQASGKLYTKICFNKDHFHKQECIPVGCLPSTAVSAGGGGACIPAYTRQGCVYPSMHLAGCVCIPACTGQGVCVSQHALGRGVVFQHALGRGMSAWGVCIPACTGQGCVCLRVSAWGCLPQGVCLGVSNLGVFLGDVCHTPCEQNHRCLWKHNSAATMLLTVTTWT